MNCLETFFGSGEFLLKKADCIPTSFTNEEFHAGALMVTGKQAVSRYTDPSLRAGRGRHPSLSMSRATNSNDGAYSLSMQYYAHW